VLAHAPRRLILSGLGDALCRCTAQADWLLSHLLLGTPFREAPFRLLEPFERELFERAAGLTRGDSAAIALLMQSLIASGKGMVLAGGSYPASQGEHVLAHTVEFLHRSEGREAPASYHGEQIGEMTLLMANLQRRILTQAAVPRLSWHAPPPEWAATYTKKIAGAEAVERLTATLHAEWSAIAARVREVTLQPVYLRGVLEAAGAPTTPEALGWTREECERAAQLAPYTRERFTFLDLAGLMGITPVLS
jgi:glycerol-1-phosphate dehydrogenase [NAD(P)+]